jgi:hypothetical protein
MTNVLGHSLRLGAFAVKNSAPKLNRKVAKEYGVNIQEYLRYLNLRIR